MNNDLRKEIALFRYSILAPLISGTYDNTCSKQAFFRHAASKTYMGPKGKSASYSVTTLSRWYQKYCKEGFDGLVPQRRIDIGTSRKLDDDMKEQIKYLKKEYPRLPATLVYQHLIQTGMTTVNTVSLSTVNRYINTLNHKEKYTNNKDMRRYERPHINQVWYGDSSVGPYIKINGKKKKVWIIALMDDASRMITGMDLFFKDNTINVISVLKSAITKFGVPKRLGYDNGPSYRNRQIKLLAARIGTTLQYSAPYTPTDKAKIERFFLTLKQQWMSKLNMKDFTSLEALKSSLMTYVQTYNNQEHKSLGKSPQDRFFEESEMIKRLTPEAIEKNFLLEIERRVSADCVIVIDKVDYEVPYRYAKQRITLRYSSDMQEVFVVDQFTGELIKIRLLNKIENSQIKREKIRLTGGTE